MNTCQNTETIITLEPFKDTDTKIFVPILKADKSPITDEAGNPLHNCYTAEELYEIAEMAYRNEKYPADPLTSQPLSIDILRKVYSAKGLNYDTLRLKDTINKMDSMIYSISYLDKTPEDEEEIIFFLKINPFLVTDITSGGSNSTVLQLVCNKALSNVAKYILENYTPAECKLNYVNDTGETALLIALKHSNLRPVVEMILEKDPFDSNIMHVRKFSYSNMTALLLASKNNYEKETLMIVEQLSRLYEEDKVADSVLLDYLKVDTEEYIQQSSSYTSDGEYDFDAYDAQPEVETRYVDVLYYAQKNNMGEVIRKVNRLIEMLETEGHSHQGGVALKYRRKKSIKRKSRRKSSKKGSRKRSYRRR